LSTAIANITNKIYRTAIYIRLSREDEKIGESESVTNQRSLLVKYVKENGYELVDTYIDDGYSGTNFNRPAFERMIEDIEAGKINMVITKDLSRLGRDYIGIGEYLERYFPQHNVRYLALTDNIDTMIDSSNIDMAPFKAVFNDMYAKDISKKIRTALRTKQKDGKWVGGCPPFGYMIDPEDKNHLVPNEDEAPIIRKIFALAKVGETPYQIRTILIDEKVPTATMLRKNSRTKHSYASKEGIWSQKTIKCILQNQLYVGDLVQNRRTKVNYKLKKTVWNAKEDWIVVENTHEPLVSKEDFAYINKILPKNSQRPEKKIFRLLDGLLYCHECKHKIGICAPRKSDGRTYLVCNYYRMHSKYGVCTSHGFNYDYLEEGILNIIKMIAGEYLNPTELKNSAGNVKISDPRATLASELITLEKDLSVITNNLDKMYLDKLEAKITDEMYERIRSRLNDEIAGKKKRIEDIRIAIGKRTKTVDIKSECDKTLNKFLKMETPTREMMLELIEKIEVHKDKQIDIHFNFRELNFLLETCHTS
jgi:DNA invertase Pin-like site-specific DNA recombinase